MSGQHKTQTAGVSASVSERPLIYRETLTQNIPDPTHQSQCAFRCIHDYCSGRQTASLQLIILKWVKKCCLGRLLSALQYKNYIKNISKGREANLRMTLSQVQSRITNYTDKEIRICLVQRQMCRCLGPICVVVPVRHPTTCNCTLR